MGIAYESRHRLRHPRRALTILIGALLLAAVPGCEQTPRPRAIVIGIDGTSPLLAFPMMEEGRLPHLSAIAERGAHGKLRSVLPLYSPRIWATIATGRPPGQHGIAAFVKRGENGEKRLYLSHDRRVPALWNVVSHSGLRVGVVNWWTTYPPEKIDGVMVSDHFFPEQIAMIKKTFQDHRASTGSLVFPESWGARALALRDAEVEIVAVADPFVDNEALPHWVNRDILSNQYRTDLQVTKVALGLIEEHRPDVMMVFLPGIDRISHWLWGNLEPGESYPPPLRPTPEERAAGAAALRRYYEYTDALIGRLIESYGPDDLVMVLSDHGFEAGVSLMLLTGEHDTPDALDGVIYASGRGVSHGAGVAGMSVFDVAPSLLAWLGLPVARDMPGHVAAFLDGEAPRTIASYDDIPVERLEATTSVHEEDIVEHLRALGYLEDERGGGEAPAGTPAE